MKIQHRTASILSLALAASFCFPPQTRAQYTSEPGAPAQPQNDANANPPQAAPANQPQAAPGQPQVSTQKPPASGATVNPSQPPLQPVTTYPDAAGGQPQTPDAPQPKTQPAGQAQDQQPQNEPQGAATAEKVPAAGGAAAKPAGVAIAPPKQHQTRSLLIKLGAVAAGAVAAGTVYALSRGTSSTPPGATGPGAMQKK
ncbi:MAG TPA: hypothetical protein VI488_13985 [Candidatus Angelobacter sp.]